MRLLDHEGDRSLNRLTIFLTSTEAKELRDSLDELLTNDQVHHEHISSSDFKKELAVTIYDIRSIGSYDSRSQAIILTDE